MIIKEIKCKTALVKCGIPGIDYVVNPYTGCGFACTYCYASFMTRFIKGVEFFDWGKFVFPKINIAEVLSKEIKTKLKDKGRGVEILLSSVTDPYQGVESKYQLTRKCLEILVKFEFEGLVSILTKSKLVTRDIDIFKKLKNVSVGLTVTSVDDNISRFFEKFAPNVTERFDALKILNENKIKTYAFIGPLLPHFVAKKEELEKIFIKLNEVGTKDIFIEHLNLSGYIRKRLFDEIGKDNKELLEKFYQSQSKKYREELEKIIRDLIKKYKMNLLMDMVIYHREFKR